MYLEHTDTHTLTCTLTPTHTHMWIWKRTQNQCDTIDTINVIFPLMIVFLKRSSEIFTQKCEFIWNFLFFHTFILASSRQVWFWPCWIESDLDTLSLISTIVNVISTTINVSFLSTNEWIFNTISVIMTWTRTFLTRWIWYLTHFIILSWPYRV
jgi:hypothetical protein